MVRIAKADTQIVWSVQCSKSHGRSSVATFRRCWKFWKSRCDLPDSRGGLLEERSQEGERGQNEKRNCSVKRKVMQLKGQLRRPRRLRRPPTWTSGMVIWQPDMPIVWLAKGRVKLTDGLKPHVTTGIWNFIWITLTWAEWQRTEHRLFWWASSRRIVG